MNRARRTPAKPFVSGGVYDPQQTAGPPQQRNYSYQNTPKKPIPTCAKAPQPVAEPVPPVVVVEEKVEQPQPKEDVVVKPQDSCAAEDEDMAEDTTEKRGKLMFKKIFVSRKKSSVRAKEKKIRQNRQLRKVILPKNALMALNEVKGVSIGDFIINSNVGGGFTAVVTVNDNQYEGKGSSKVIAKNSACEKALRAFVLAKMRQKPRRVSRPASVSGDNAMDTSEQNGENSVESDGGDSQKPSTDDTDDVPMINLASFALYKLFSEWESEGFEIPEFHPSSYGQANSNDSDSVPVKEPKKPPIRNELPPNWETMHPATLLCLMRPGLAYSDYGVDGEKPNTIQNVGVIVDEQEFVGRGRSKKLARRNAAATVCNTLFGTNFTQEEPNATVS